MNDNNTLLELENCISILEAEAAKFKKQESDPKKRYAFDWYVKEQDRFYWNMTSRHIGKLRQKLKGTIALAVTSTVVVIAAILLFLLQRKK